MGIVKVSFMLLVMFIPITILGVVSGIYMIKNGIARELVLGIFGAVLVCLVFSGILASLFFAPGVFLGLIILAMAVCFGAYMFHIISISSRENDSTEETCVNAQEESVINCN